MNKELLILPEHTLSFVKSEFTTLFPYLKPEFYKDNKNGANKFSKDALLNTELPIGKFMKGVAERVIIHEAMTVADVEEVIFNVYRIRAKVYRKSGVSWLETTMTMDWRLDYQNMQGEATTAYLSGRQIGSMNQ